MSRLVADGGPIVRPDGVVVAKSEEAFGVLDRIGHAPSASVSYRCTVAAVVRRHESRR